MRKLIIVILFAVLLCSCSITKDEEEYRITNIKIFKDTPVWSVAKDVKSENVKEIEAFFNDNPDLIDFQEPTHGATLLLWSVGMDKYESTETLLSLGANPDIATTKFGSTPLFVASWYPWNDKMCNEDPKFVKLLLDYGADPNMPYKGFEEGIVSSIVESGTTPVMRSIGSGMEKTIALVEAGADLTLKTESGRGVVMQSLLVKTNIEYAYYLIVELKLDVTESYDSRYKSSDDDTLYEMYPVTLLRNQLFDLNSDEYRMKMEIVEEFERQGVKYKDEPIPKDKLEQIKYIYPYTWEEYIEYY